MCSMRLFRNELQLQLRSNSCANCIALCKTFPWECFKRVGALLLQFKDKAREKERQKRIAARALMPKASHLMRSPCLYKGAHTPWIDKDGNQPWCSW